tara:strand:- start:1721 stop:1996 length:276 start_codon:yes stop_codon:yes gene_type:complete
MSEETLLKKIKTVINKQIQPAEVELISGTAETSNLRGYAIQAIEDSTFSALVITNQTGNTNLDTKTLLAGHIWYGEIDTVQLATGSVLIYK